MRECINYANVRHVLGADFPLTLLTFDQAEVDGKLGRDLLDEVAGDIEGVEGNILHQEENCIRKLGQLTLAQVCKEDVIIIRSGDWWSFVRSRCVLIRVSDIFSVLVSMLTRMAVFTVHMYTLYSTADTLNSPGES